MKYTFAQFPERKFQKLEHSEGDLVIKFINMLCTYSFIALQKKIKMFPV